MPGHLETTISITTGPEVAGLKINDVVPEAIWPNAGEPDVANGVRDYFVSLLVLSHNIATGGPLHASETFVRQNVTYTN